MTKLIDRIKLIVSKNDPNLINLLTIDNNKVLKNNYQELMNFWKNAKENEDSEVYKEYLKIKNINKENFNSNIGIFSLFYFKGCDNFLSVGNYENDIFYMEIKCKQYENVLSNAMDNENELFVLTYWIL